MTIEFMIMWEAKKKRWEINIPIGFLHYFTCNDIYITKAMAVADARFIRERMKSTGSIFVYNKNGNFSYAIPSPKV